MTGLEYLLQKQSKFVLIFALFSSSFIFSEAIVNVEDLRRDGEKGFFANISGSLSFLEEIEIEIVFQFNLLWITT